MEPGEAWKRAAECGRRAAREKDEALRIALQRMRDLWIDLAKAELSGRVGLEIDSSVLVAIEAAIGRPGFREAWTDGSAQRRRV